MPSDHPAKSSRCAGSISAGPELGVTMGATPRGEPPAEGRLRGRVSSNVAASPVRPAPRPGEDQLVRNGISIGMPNDWNGRLLYRDESGATGVIYQVANFELPKNRGFEPPTVKPGEEDAIK